MTAPVIAIIPAAPRPKRYRPPKRIKRHVYVAYAPLVRLFKFGISVEPSIRVGDLAKERRTPVVLLGAMRGDLHDERAIHAHLCDWRASGEWYEDVPEVRLAAEGILGKPVDEVFAPERATAGAA